MPYEGLHKTVLATVICIYMMSLSSDGFITLESSVSDLLYATKKGLDLNYHNVKKFCSSFSHHSDNIVTPNSNAHQMAHAPAILGGIISL